MPNEQLLSPIRLQKALSVNGPAVRRAVTVVMDGHTWYARIEM